MTNSAPARLLPAALPPTYCVAGDGMYAAHEWIPMRGNDLHCRRCLMRLDLSQQHDWLRQARHDRLEEPLAFTDLETVNLAADALNLTPLERRVLLGLACRPDMVIGYTELAESVWGVPTADADDRVALRQHIAGLRRKLSSLRAEITTVASVGYRFGFSSSADMSGD